LADNPDLAEDVELFYPYYHKGYGLMPVGEIERGKVPSHYGGERDKDVVVLDWCTMLHTDECCIEDTREVSKKLRGDKNEMS
jgi:hypothetical protein